MTDETQTVSVRPAIHDGPRYAVLFRTHIWDEFVQRQYRRAVSQVGSGDLFIVANNTTGSCPEISGLPFFSFTEPEIEALGYLRAGAGEMLWFNVDYALYIFKQRYPQYDYYVLFEYDVVSMLPIDDLISAVSQRGMDLVGLTKGESFSDWWYRSTSLELWPEADIRKMLLPLAVFSRRAVDYLSDRRLALAADHRAARIAAWPHCEAFIVTELSLGGFAIAELSEYGPTHRLAHQPAYLEDDLDQMPGSGFVHPLLDSARYVASTIKYEGRPESYLLPASDFRRRLSRFPFSLYAKPLGSAMRRRLASLPKVLARKISRRLRSFASHAT